MHSILDVTLLQLKGDGDEGIVGKTDIIFPDAVDSDTAMWCQHITE